MAELTTLPRLLLRNAREFPRRTALREKDRGIWQAWTWSDYLQHVRHFALGLAALGFKRGDRLSVIGDNRPRLYAAQLAAQSLGGVSVPVFQDSIAKELAYVWNHADVSIIVAEDQEQVDKVLALRDQLPTFRHVIYEDPRGMLGYRYDWLTSLADVEAQGRERTDRDGAPSERATGKGHGAHVAFTCHPPGTTGSPRGAMLTHTNGIAPAKMAVAWEDFRRDDVSPAYLPMAWVGDAFYTL